MKTPASPALPSALFFAFETAFSLCASSKPAVFYVLSFLLWGALAVAAAVLVFGLAAPALRAAVGRELDEKLAALDKISRKDGDRFKKVKFDSLGYVK